MRHFWPLTIAAVLFAFAAQAGQLNTPTFSGAQTMQPPPPKADPITVRKQTDIASPKLLQSSTTGSNTKPRHPPQPCKTCAAE
jgi:hypothetical protein